mgnify:FL=1
MTKVDGLVIQWFVGGGRAQIENIFGRLDLEVLLAGRTGKTGNQKYKD